MTLGKWLLKTQVLYVLFLVNRKEKVVKRFIGEVKIILDAPEFEANSVEEYKQLVVKEFSTSMFEVTEDDVCNIHERRSYDKATSY